MTVPGVYASCRYARITPGTVNRKTAQALGHACFDFRLVKVR